MSVRPTTELAAEAPSWTQPRDFGGLDHSNPGAVGGWSPGSGFAVEDAALEPVTPAPGKGALGTWRLLRRNNVRTQSRVTRLLMAGASLGANCGWVGCTRVSSGLLRQEDLLVHRPPFVDVTVVATKAMPSARPCQWPRRVGRVKAARSARRRRPKGLDAVVAA